MSSCVLLHCCRARGALVRTGSRVQGLRYSMDTDVLSARPKQGPGDARTDEASAQPPFRGPRRDITAYYKPMVVFVLTALGLFAYFKREEKEAEKKRADLMHDATGSVGEAKIGGPFTLTNHQGQTVTERDFFGQFLLLYFGFTHCPDICPDELDRLGTIVDVLDKDPATKDKLTPVFVTVDPRRDGPQQVAKYLQDFHPKIAGLTGTPEQILSFAKLYRVYCSKNTEMKENEDYLVDHSVFFYLMGPHGKFVDFFGREMSAEQIAAKTGQYIQKAKELGMFMPPMDTKRAL